MESATSVTSAIGRRPSRATQKAAAARTTNKTAPAATTAKRNFPAVASARVIDTATRTCCVVPGREIKTARHLSDPDNESTVTGRRVVCPSVETVLGVRGASFPAKVGSSDTFR